MVLNKSLIIPLFVVFLSSLVIAQSIKIEFPNGNEFGANKAITLKITLYDSNSNPIDKPINVIIEDVEKRKKIEKTVQSKELTNIDLGESLAGEWIITAKNQDTETSESFFIIAEKKVKFDLEGEILKITNMGNIVYMPLIEITIGDTTGTKEPKLEVGESVSYRLIAPKGAYNIKIVDKRNPNSVLTKNDVELSGKGLTGKTIGIIDEEVSKRSPLTGGISPKEESDEAILSYLRGSKFVYVFILVIFGAMILLAIEKRFKKKN